MAMAHQHIVALILLIAAVLLLIRQAARMIGGKSGGCSCAPRREKPADEDISDPPEP